MAKKLRLDTLSCDDVKHIDVDKHILKMTDLETIEFQNKLEGKPVAYIRFYEIQNKEPGLEISGFCTGELGESGDVFKVEGTGNGKRDCKVAKSGDFAYSVQADNHKLLDPVIIVEPTTSTFMFAVLATVAALAALVGVYTMGRSHGRKSGAS